MDTFQENLLYESNPMLHTCPEKTYSGDEYDASLQRVRMACDGGQCDSPECVAALLDHHCISRERFELLIRDVPVKFEKSYECQVIVTRLEHAHCTTHTVELDQDLDFKVPEKIIESRFYSVSLFNALVATQPDHFVFHRARKAGVEDVAFVVQKEGFPERYFDLSTDEPAVSSLGDTVDENKPSYSVVKICTDMICVGLVKKAHTLKPEEFNVRIRPSRLTTFREVLFGDVIKALSDGNAKCGHSVKVTNDYKLYVQQKDVDLYYPVALFVAALMDEPDSFMFYRYFDNTGKEGMVFSLLKGDKTIGYYNLSTDIARPGPCN